MCSYVEIWQFTLQAYNLVSQNNENVTGFVNKAFLICISFFGMNAYLSDFGPFRYGFETGETGIDFCDTMPQNSTDCKNECLRGRTGGGGRAKVSCNTNRISRPITFVSFHM